MSLIAKESGGSNIPPLEQDIYEAVCLWIIDMGTQVEEYKGEAKTKHKCFMTFVVPSETVLIDGEKKPRVVSREYPVSLHERATLRAHLEAWRGRQFTDEELRGFDLRNVVGKPCRIQTGLTSGGNTKIVGILKPKEPAKIPEEMEAGTFVLDDFDGGDLPEWIPNFVKDKIAESPEYQRKTQNSTPAQSQATADESDEPDEEMPF